MHTPRRLAVLVVTMGLVALAGCADDDDGDSSLAVGDDAATTSVGIDTVPATEAAPPDTALEWNDIATVTETTVGSDEDQIRYAFETWILPDTPTDVRVSLMEGGEARRDVIEAGFEENAGLISAVSAEVDAVTFLDDDHAEVVFRILWGDGPSPYFPDPLTGLAVRVDDGSWRVSRETLCTLQIGALGGPCDDPPGTASTSVPVPGASTPTTAVGPQPVVVWVSNQSFDVPSVDLVVSIDGVVIADQTFTVDGQHTFVRFDATLEPGQHVIDVEATGRSVASSMPFVVDDPEWITAFFWDEAASDEPIEIQHFEDEVFFD